VVIPQLSERRIPCELPVFPSCDRLEAAANAPPFDTAAHPFQLPFPGLAGSLADYSLNSYHKDMSMDSVHNAFNANSALLLGLSG